MGHKYCHGIQKWRLLSLESQVIYAMKTPSKHYWEITVISKVVCVFVRSGNTYILNAVISLVIHDSKQERVTKLKMEIGEDGPSTLRLRNCISMITPIFCNYKQTIAMKVTFKQVFPMKTLHILMTLQMVLNLNGLVIPVISEACSCTLFSVRACPTILKLLMKKQDKNK